MQTTRQEILNYLCRHGEATVRQLGDLLGMTSTGIRQHLAVLERDGHIAVRETLGRTGRPAFVYSLTPAGDALYPKRYADLSNVLLDEVRAMTGGRGLQALLMRAAARFAEPYQARMEGKELAERVAETASIINERGYIVDTESYSEGEFLINQYTCPFPNVAKCNSGVCALEVEFVRRLTGGDARLVRSLLRKDKSCTYRIRPAQTATASN